MGLRPSAERRRGAGLVDQCHHDPQHDQENEDPGRTLNRGNEAFVDYAVHRLQRSEPRRQRTAQQDPDEEGGIDFFRDQGENDRQQGRDQCPERTGETAFFFFCHFLFHRCRFCRRSFRCRGGRDGIFCCLDGTCHGCRSFVFAVENQRHGECCGKDQQNEGEGETVSEHNVFPVFC